MGDWTDLASERLLDYIVAMSSIGASMTFPSNR